SIMAPLGLEASYYGHAASGLLHVRPVLDLHSASDLKKFRQVADQTSALVKQFKGSLPAEHGVGIARTEYMREQLGDELLEVMCARDRAKRIRAARELRVHGHDPLKSDELDAALSNCLSCKGCTPECPSNVNLALLTAELMYARHQRDGLPLRERILSNVDLLGRIGCAMPSLANASLNFRPLRVLMEKALGLSA